MIETVELTPTLEKEIAQRQKNIGYAVMNPEIGARGRPGTCESEGHLVQMRQGEWPLRKKSPTRPPSGAGKCLVCGCHVTAQEHTPPGVMRIVVPAKRGAA
jgi:hypothetical protein